MEEYGRAYNVEENLRKHEIMLENMGECEIMVEEHGRMWDNGGRTRENVR